MNIYEHLWTLFEHFYEWTLLSSTILHVVRKQKAATERNVWIWRRGTSKTSVFYTLLLIIIRKWDLALASPSFPVAQWFLTFPATKYFPQGIRYHHSEVFSHSPSCTIRPLHTCSQMTPRSAPSTLLRNHQMFPQFVTVSKACLPPNTLLPSTYLMSHTPRSAESCWLIFTHTIVHIAK